VINAKISNNETAEPSIEKIFGKEKLNFKDKSFYYLMAKIGIN